MLLGFCVWGCVELCNMGVCDSVCGCVTLWVHLVCMCVSVCLCVCVSDSLCVPRPLAALGGRSARPDVGHAGSPFLLNVPLASLDRVCSCFGGALVELGGREPMPFLLMHNVTADACVKCYGGTRRSPQPGSGYTPSICASVHHSEVGGEGAMMGTPSPG